MSETELIEKAQNGDRSAFRSLVEQWQGFVYSIAYRFVGNSADAEDLVQESFIRLWNNLKRYNPEMSMKPWLGRIVTNICLDFLKSAKAKQSKRLSELTEANVKSDPDNPEQAFDQAELQEVIKKLAQALTPKQQSVFVLRDLEQLEVDEVVKALNISSELVKSNLYHARVKIKEGLLMYYGERLIRT